MYVWLFHAMHPVQIYYLALSLVLLGKTLTTIVWCWQQWKDICLLPMPIHLLTRCTLLIAVGREEVGVREEVREEVCPVFHPGNCTWLWTLETRIALHLLGFLISALIWLLTAVLASSLTGFFYNFTTKSLDTIVFMPAWVLLNITPCIPLL